MHRRLALLTLAPLLAFAAGCGDDDDDGDATGADAGTDAVPPPAIDYPTPGSLVTAAGKGSFRFGAASAATQIEDMNVHTDWYLWTRPVAEGGLGKGTFVGDAARGYSKAIADVALVADLQLDSYRFSIEWARVEPVRDQIDEAAIAHYRAQLEALVAAGVKPMITLHHFSNPVWVDDPRDLDCTSGPTDANLCGFGHPEGGPQIVAEMAELATRLGGDLGDLVDEWATLNEPMNYMLASHGAAIFPPGKMKIFAFDELVDAVRDYFAGHAAMYTALKAADTVDADGDGLAAAVGLTLSVADWVASQSHELSTDPADVAARERLIYVYHHLLVESFLAGTFDPDLDGVGDEPHPEWAGTLDWLGVQYYFRAGVTSSPPLIPALGLTPCFGTFDLGACVAPTDPTYCVPTMGYEFYAPGLYDILADLGERFPSLPLVVSEAGIATEVGERRAENIVRILEQIERARADGVDVRGYYHWSLYDNFEWAEGFAPRFGLYTVDYTTYARTPTLGATVLGEITGARTLTSAQRATYGGSGPMTPEPDVSDSFTYCGETRPAR